MSSLPPEILHTIITSYLNPSTDTPTLHALSLTHSFLLPATRAALFYTIRLTRHHLDDGVHPHLCHAFATLLHRSPYIARFVRKLIIIEGTIRNSWYGSTRFWVNSEDEELPFILRMVAYGGKDISSPANPTWSGIGLRSLEILGFGKAIMNWETFSPELRRALVDVFEHGRLEDLRLVGVNNFPIHLLKVNQSLTNMSFGWMDIATRTPDSHTGSDFSAIVASNSSLPQPKLKYLDLSFEHQTGQGTTLIDALTQSTCPINSSQLEHLVINGEQHHNIQQLLSHCQDELQVLEIRNNEYPIPTPPKHINLSSLTSLHSLSLLVPVIDWDHVTPNPFPWLNHLLSTLCTSSHRNQSTTTNTSLHTLHLIFDVDRVSLFERIHTIEWTTLNGQLTRLLNIKPFDTSAKNRLEINIFIFTDFDSYTMYPGPQSPYLKDSVDSDFAAEKENRDGNERMCRGENIYMRLFLARFLPVLGAPEGMERIRVFQTGYIPRL